MAIASGRRRLMTDGAWVSFGQIGSALGALAGVRLLTEYITPAVFGATTLIIGITALALGTLVSPVMQASLKYYPEYSGEREAELRASLRSILFRRVGTVAAVITVVTLLISMFSRLDPYLILICVLLLILDSMRSYQTTLLNAARKHAAFAMISIGEAWGRPLLAVLAVQSMGADFKTILMAYVATTAGILLLFYVFVRQKDPSMALPSEPEKETLQHSIRQFALPLVPMSALGWMNGIGDRYLIGALLGLEQAGIYAAVYGLMSRPFQMVSGIVELTLRPLYNQLVADGRESAAHGLLLKWLSAVALLTGAGFVGIALFEREIISLLLADKYRSGLSLMLWIAGGYLLLALSDVFVKVCYAYGYTRRILGIQIVGALLSIVSAYAGIKLFGLVGAAMAVPVYFGAMLIITFVASTVNVKRRHLPELDCQLITEKS
ncbi:MAG: lipopolysaccharide biosynthesis protein [Geobacteraceae bacterium]|nr:lipopolysaccharide biosynthesis protein [Geobacteraceae bacterium]